MRIEREILLVVALQQQGGGTCYLGRIAVPLPAVTDLAERHGGIHRRRGVGKHLQIVDLVVLLGRSEDPEVDLQLLVEGELGDVQLGGEIAVVLVPDDRLSPHIAQRSTVVRCPAAAAEGDVMRIDKACPHDFLLEIGIISFIDIDQPQRLRRPDIPGGIQHVEPFVHVLETYRPVVIDLEPAALAALRPHLDDTRCTPRTVLGGLGGVLENREALDVGGVDGRQGGKVGGDTVDDDQRVVAAGKGGGTAHAHTRQHGHAVLSVRNDVYAHRLTRKGIECRTYQTFVHLFLPHFRYRPDDGQGVTDVEQRLFLNDSTWLVLSLRVCHAGRSRYQKAANERPG